MSFCSFAKGLPRNICRLRVCVIINKRSFEPFICLDLVVEGEQSFLFNISGMLNVGRYQFYDQTHIVWNTMENEVFQEQRELGHMPLVLGDSFNITGHLHNDSLTLTLNAALVYSIPLGHLQNGIDGVDVSQSTLLGINGKVELTYINLISAC